LKTSKPQIESKERFRGLLESAPDAMVIVNQAGEIVLVNAQTEQLFGYSRNELLGKPVEVLIPMDSRRRHRKFRSSYFTNFTTPGTRPIEIGRDLSGRRKDGSIFSVEVNLSPFTSENEVLVTAAIRDATLRRQTEEKIREASRAKSDFVAKMSHEIRTPLNAIIGSTELLELSNLSQEQKRRMKVIRSSGELLLTIVNDILDFSKLVAGKVILETIEFDLIELVDEAVDSFAHLMSAKGVQLSFYRNPNLPRHVIGDPYRLRQILGNLLSNALKFTHEGEVQVRASVDSETAETFTIRFEVIDTGIGLSPESGRKLFEPFMQAEPSGTRRYGGTGLGLAICAQTVKQMQGEIGFESAIGKGSSFHFTVRLEKAKPDAIRMPNPPAPQELPVDLAAPSDTASRRRIRVLVVEDNAVNRTLVTEQLGVMGYTAVVVEDGPSALQAIDSDTYDIVLMDCEMPGMDGYETTRRIRQREGKRVPVAIVALTAHVSKGEEKRCQDAGMDDYLSKPVRLKSLAAMIDKWAPAMRSATGVAASDELSEHENAFASEQLDPEALDELRELSQETGRNLIRELTDTLLSQFDQVRIRTALKDGDLSTLAGWAHSLKGSTAVIGARRFSELCAETEMSARGGDTSRATVLAEEIVKRSRMLGDALMRAATK
jgi:PAS domain S-box-containing protein